MITLIIRNCILQVGLTIVDIGYGKTPDMQRDSFWDEPIEPLYSEEAVMFERRRSGVTGSIAHLKYDFNYSFIFLFFHWILVLPLATIADTADPQKSPIPTHPWLFAYITIGW